MATWAIARMAVTWAIARKAVELILPMSLETLKALTWGMVCSEVPSLQIEMVWRPIQARHRQFQMRQTLFATNLYLSWVKMLSSVRGRPPYLKHPVQKQVVRWLLGWQPTSLAAHRARLLTVVATSACSRVNEVALLQVCDLWWDHLTGYGVPGSGGTCSLRIVRRKHDTQCKGHWPALGRPRDWSVDIVQQLDVSAHGGDVGYRTRGGDVGYSTHGSDVSYRTHGSDVGYRMHGGNVGYRTHGGDVGYRTQGSEADPAYVVGDAEGIGLEHGMLRGPELADRDGVSVHSSAPLSVSDASVAV